MLAWAEEARVDKRLIVVSKLMQNRVCESLNDRMRDELLKETLFFGLAHARAALVQQMADYNEHRSHSTLRYPTLAGYAATFHNG
jgi:putative transposase